MRSPANMPAASAISAHCGQAPSSCGGAALRHSRRTFGAGSGVVAAIGAGAAALFAAARAAQSAQPTSTGVASAMRQNALAKGPRLAVVSASRTNTPASPSTAPPRSKTKKSMRPNRP
ncbi:hypothetical protein GALL_427690 [mine drainage metagenome]|uniref:Uncharacterized protein n=1 Tax=mine drainage metagenome TaxID=410659 RepID=A0A1J5QHU9_9ZZZZ